MSVSALALFLRKDERGQFLYPYAHRKEELILKRFLIALCALLCLLSLAACGQKAAPEPEAEARLAEKLEALDREMIRKNLSPGGCADLLSITYFLHFYSAQTEENQI